MKLNYWLAVSGVLFLAGCGAAAVFYTPYDLKAPVRAIKNPADVLIISDVKQITKPYKEIGTLLIEPNTANSATLMEYLREKAAQIGADAIINIQDTSNNKINIANYGSVNGGFPFLIFNNSTVTKIKGTAIIFTEVLK